MFNAVPDEDRLKNTKIIKIGPVVLELIDIDKSMITFPCILRVSCLCTRSLPLSDCDILPTIKFKTFILEVGRKRAPFQVFFLIRLALT